jgi:hypothetical protein
MHVIILQVPVLDLGGHHHPLDLVHLEDPWALVILHLEDYLHRVTHHQGKLHQVPHLVLHLALQQDIHLALNQVLKLDQQ